MQIILLGTGTPIPDPNRSGPALAVIKGESVYIIDFGPGVVRRAVAAGIKPSQLTTAFLTHMHSDHTTGYPDLIFTPAVEGRRDPLMVYGPEGLSSMTQKILSAFDMDVQERKTGLEPTPMSGYEVEVKEISSGVIYSKDEIIVEAFPVEHGSWPAFGYKFKSPTKTIAISGDTSKSESLMKHVNNCDILIHEVYSAEGLKTRSPDWIHYHSTYHTSTYELGKIARRVKPNLLVLYHQLYMGKTDDDLITEIRTEYAGPVVSGKDLDIF